MVYEISLTTEWYTEIIGIYNNEERAKEALAFYEYFFKDDDEVITIDMMEFTEGFTDELYRRTPNYAYYTE